MRLTLLIAAGLIVGVGLSARAEDAMGVFQETSKAWETAYNAGKADSIAALYAEDATFISGALGSLRGRAAIEEAVAHQMKKSPSVKNTPIEAQMRGDVMWGRLCVLGVGLFTWVRVNRFTTRSITCGNWRGRAPHHARGRLQEQGQQRVSCESAATP